MITDLDKYILSCVKVGKKPSGVKISNFKRNGINKTLSDEDLFSIANNIEVPLCESCKLESVSLISFKTGFGKYCSKACYAKSLSKRNSKNNKTLNKIKGKKIKQQRIKEFGSDLQKAVDEYINSGVITLKEISIKYQIPISYIRETLLDYYNSNCIPTKRKASAWRYKISQKMEDIDIYLCDPEWLSKAQRENKTTSMIAEELGCSSNYVATKSRQIGMPFRNNNSISSYEIIFTEFLKEKGIEVINNNRKILNGLEIDIYLPKYNIGIEINGVYWHQFLEESNQDFFFAGKRNFDKNYHKNKTDTAKQNGVSLIHINDYEFNDNIKLSIFKSIIYGKCGFNKKIYARKCDAREINDKDYKDFLNLNHLEGKISSDVKLGLFHNDELLMVSGFSNSFPDNKNEWELDRMCSKTEIVVVGGASKLFQYFKRKYNPNSIISYCNRNCFDGGVYKKLGMNKIFTQPPNCKWVKYEGKKVIIKCGHQINKDNITSSENYMKIYDCGHDVFYWRSSMEENAINSLQPLIYHFQG